MNKWIRWKGLVAFIVIFAVMAVIWLVLVDWIAEKAIETAGTRAVGAKVDVVSVDVTLFPAGAEVTGLAVTDPDQPMNNAVAIKRLHAAIELPPLLRRKMIVNDLRIEGLQFNTARSKSGALPRTRRKTETEDSSKIPPWLAEICGAKPAARFSIPSVDDILSREPLQSLEQAKDIQSKIDTAQASWQDRLKDLPSQKDLEAYSARIEKLKGGGGLANLLGSANEAKTLHDDIRKDLKQIQKAQESFKAELQSLKKQTADLARAPALEARRLQQKYALSAQGAANLSRTLFGPQVCGWWYKVHYWYQRISPYLERKPAKSGEPETVTPVRGKGTDVRFAETHPLPDFLIRQVHVDAQLETGKFTGQMADITSQPHILGKPLTFKFLGRQLKQLQAVNLNGVVNLVQPDNPQHTIKMLVEELALENLDIGDGGDLPISIAQALTNFKLNLDLSGPKLDAVLDAHLQNVQMALQGKAADALSQAIGDAISSVSKFSVLAEVKGTDPDYIARLKSDLDNVLEKAVGRLVQKAGARLKSQLQKAISEKIEGAVGDTRNRLNGLNSLGPEFSKRLNLGNNLLDNIKLPF